MKQNEKLLYNEFAQHNLQNVDASPLMGELFFEVRSYLNNHLTNYIRN
jgi:hypothetical protein